MAWSKEKATEEFDDTFAFLKTLKNSPELDDQVKQLHEETFEKTDCLACANCCKTTPPIVLKSDAKRIAKFLGIPPKTFIRQYLMEDYDGSYVMNFVPCPFLQDDYKCKVYEARPTACRNYPHTDEADFGKRAKLNAHNTIVCPATYEIVQKLKAVK